QLTMQTIRLTRRYHAAAFTLPEFMVTLGLGGLVFAALASMTFFVAVSMGNISNYADLDSQSAHALDRMTMEIRQADRVAAARTNQVILNYGGVSNSLSYTWNPSTRQLIRTNGTQVETLLTGCTNLVFSYFSRIPVSNQFDQFQPDLTNTVTIKLIKVD